ncbi:MAG: DeoR/GlpR transcriptional regulator, partial [Solobacterium sp.]|nr:DeoR/GlpR transcriptional regulator [Solobacterium sp.]
MTLKRINSIAEYILSYDVCTYEELCEHFDVSLSTMRRDVEELIAKGIVEKTYGGIRKAENYKEDNQEHSSLFKFDYNKDKIARAASELVEDNEIIALASGTTVAHMVRYLKDKRNLTIITNNLLVLNEALRYNMNVISIGGILDRKVLSTASTQAIMQMRDLNADKCFISCNGITNKGISNVADLEANMKKAEIEISREVIVLTDSSKFGVTSLYTICS